MADMKNIAGTLLPTFKFRPSGGIELISSAVKGDNGEIISQFKVKDSSGIHRVAYYDTVIESKDISSMTYRGGMVHFKVKVLNDMGEVEIKEISLAELIHSSEISIEPGEEDEVAIYGADGRTLKGAGVKFTNNAEDIKNGNSKTIPTSKAVLNFIDEGTVPLQDRLAGDNVKKVLD